MGESAGESKEGGELENREALGFSIPLPPWSVISILSKNQEFFRIAFGGVTLFGSTPLAHNGTLEPYSGSRVVG